MRIKKFNYIAVVVLIIIFGLVPLHTTAKEIPFTTKSPEALNLLQQGLEKWDGLQYDEARELFKKVIAADPDCPIAYYFLAYALTTGDEAVKTMKKAIALAPKASVPEQVMIRAGKAVLEGKNQEVNKLMVQLVQVAPGSARAHTMLGDNLAGRQQYTEAEDEYKKAIELDPSYPSAYNQLAYTLAAVGRYPEAIEALKKYATLLPKAPNPHDSMGEIYLWMGDHTNSMAEYNASLALDPKFSGSILGLGNNFLFMGQFDKARETYSTWQQQAKDYGDSNLVYTWRALSYLHEGRTSDAINEWMNEDAFGKTHNDLYLQIDAHVNLAAIYLNMKDFEKMEAENKIIQNLISDSSITTASHDQNMRTIVSNEAIQLANQGKSTEAMTKFSEFKKLSEQVKTPGMDRTIHFVKGEIAFGENNYNLALNELSQADMQNPLVKYHMGICLEKQGKTKDAKDLFNWVVKWNHNDINLAMTRPEALKKIM